MLRDLNWTRFLFESMVVRDLRVYAQALDGQLFHYRDNTGLEADAIIELPHGRWAGFEIKLGSSPVVVDAAAEAMLKLTGRVATDHGLYSVAKRRPVSLASPSAKPWLTSEART
ncbi:hypothetical protein BH20CHL6_BH20CHL6_02570 [soil metagenome]